METPCSKWHHSPSPSLAKHGPQAYQTTTTTTATARATATAKSRASTATRTIILPRTAAATATTRTTTVLPRRITNTENQNNIILTIQEPQQQQQRPISVAQIYDATTNLSYPSETVTEPETIEIQLKPTQRLLIITSAPSSGQPKIVQIRRQPRAQTRTQTQTQTLLQQATQQQQVQQQQKQQQSRRIINLQQLQRARLARLSRIAKPSASAIRVPFLPGSPSTPSTVKLSSPIRKNSNLVTLTSPLTLVEGLPTNNRNTITQIKQTQSPAATNTVYYTTLDLNPNQTSAIHTTQSPNLFVPLQQQQQSSHSSVQFSQTQTQTQTQPPKTLAAMAGIQLTGADEHMSLAYMSGATPTATVEEINVPVFIDEYLQQPGATPTEAATNINYSQISSSNNICQSNSSIGSNANNNITNGNGFEDFDFDMDLFADSSDAEVYSNSNSNSNNNNNNIIITTNNSDNNNMNNSDIDTVDICDTLFSCINNNNINNNNNMLHQPIIKFENSHNSSEHLALSAEAMLEEFLMDSDISATIGSPTLNDFSDLSENAIDINHWNFNEPLVSSQDPMFSNQSQTCSTVNSQSFQNSEPIVPKIEENDELPCEDYDMLCMAPPEAEIVAPIIIPSSSIPTHNSRMQQKRLKLHLSAETVADPLSTPTILRGLADLQNERMAVDSPRYMESSVNDIVEALQDSTNLQFVYTEDDLPSTPQSYTSATTYTNEYTPSSPAHSNISFNQLNTSSSASNKKKRGRPAKAHSDQPDPMQLENMSESDRKKLLDRAKNNEASRVSRRKNKQREESEKEMEHKLLEENSKLKAEFSNINREKLKLKRALERGLRNRTH
ncbi:putative uncharacterized protein DDB_G0282129 [Ceratitis capitata]|uniref:putative uncharacterized protein DDB_G0282129 n=1 Tax=Ceratitis capitata TaxID=7213 RepID=UPI00061892BD|nr:putative uncharacterized protein DDB_G0282129 [Ceratitis capitata]